MYQNFIECRVLFASTFMILLFIFRKPPEAVRCACDFFYYKNVHYTHTQTRAHAHTHTHTRTHTRTHTELFVLNKLNIAITLSLLNFQNMESSDYMRKHSMLSSALTFSINMCDMYAAELQIL